MIFGLSLIIASQFFSTLWVIFFYDQNEKNLFWIYLITRLILSIGSNIIEIYLFIILMIWFYDMKIHSKIAHMLCFRCIVFMIVKIVFINYQSDLAQIMYPKDNHKNDYEKEKLHLQLSLNYFKYLHIIGLMLALCIVISCFFIHKKQKVLDQLESQIISEENEGDGQISLIQSLKLLKRKRFLVGTLCSAIALCCFYIFTWNFENFFKFSTLELFLEGDSFKRICKNELNSEVNQILIYKKNWFYKNIKFSAIFLFYSELIAIISGFIISRSIRKNGETLNILFLGSILMGIGYIIFGILFWF